MNFVTVEVVRKLGWMTAPVEEGTPVDLYQGPNLIASAPTNASGQAAFFLPGGGAYRFHTEWWGREWWSSLTDDCSPGSCLNNEIDVSGVAVTVTKPNDVPAPPGISVNAYTGGPPG